jgi:formylglycine-generating enzyme required for sulfatase activity
LSFGATAVHYELSLLTKLRPEVCEPRIRQKSVASNYDKPNEPAINCEAGVAAPPGMVCIAGGEFTMGTNDVRSFPNERPAHRERVEGFWIDEHDVSNAEFAKFVEATGYVTTAEKNRTGKN